MIPRMRAACAIAAAILFASGTAGTAMRHPPVAAAEQAGGYADLVSLFTEWRAFQKPKLVDGVPDYTADGDVRAAARAAGLPAPPRRHRSGRLAGSAAGGLAHRPRRDERPRLRSPRDPAVGEQPGLLRHRLHLRRAISRRARGILRTPRWSSGATSFRSTPSVPAGSPPAFARSRSCSIRRSATSPGTRRISGRSARARSSSRAPTWRRLAPRVAGAAGNARRPTSRGRRRRPTRSRSGSTRRRRAKRAPSGVGVENYNWYLKNVQLVPYTWQDEVTIMQRELARAHAFLALEERRNAALPAQAPIANADDFNRRFNEAVNAVHDVPPGPARS